MALAYVNLVELKSESKPKLEEIIIGFATGKSSAEIFRCERIVRQAGICKKDFGKIKPKPYADAVAVEFNFV